MTTSNRKAYRRAYYLAHKDKAINAAKEWRLANPMRFKELQDKLRHRYAKTSKIARERWRLDHPDKIKKYKETQRDNGNQARGVARWRLRHPEKARAIAKSWWSRNPHKSSLYATARRAAQLQATPSWADIGVIENVYKEAIVISKRTGIKHHVDHIWPLRGRGYRGLHVVWNLRIIPAGENLRKHNKRPI